jgi:hypothetical protein
MSRFRIVPVSIAALAILSTTLACSIGSSKATPTPAPTAVVEQPTNVALPTDVSVATDVPLTLESPATELPSPTATIDAPKGVVIIDKSAYTDSSGYYNVVGQVLNNTDAPITNINLSVSVTDASGKSLLTDSSDQPVETETFSPSLYTLAPGEISPFNYYVNLNDKEASAFDVTVASQDTTEVERPKVQVENDALFTDTDGDLHYSGELVNLSDKPVKVSSLAGAVLDQAGTVLVTASTSSVSEYLMPAGDSTGMDRTPFTVYMSGPVSNVAQPRAYVDAEVIDPEDNHDITVTVSNTYTDGSGGFHLVGTLTNNGTDILTANLVAGLYGADKKVLDAESTGAPLYLTPGVAIPFDLDSFSSLNFDPDRIKQVDTYTVQIDPYWTFAASSEIVTLKTSGDKQTDGSDGHWTITGNVANASGKALSSETVLVAASDAQGKVIGVGADTVFPDGDSIAAGHTDPYSADIYFAPDVDVSQLTFTTIVQGAVK